MEDIELPDFVMYFLWETAALIYFGLLRSLVHNTIIKLYKFMLKPHKGIRTRSCVEGIHKLELFNLVAA